MYDYYFSTFKNDNTNPVNMALSPLTFDTNNKTPNKLFMDPSNRGFY